ncbi:MAG TPA: ATP-binding protein [Syntrophales bacterium]|nr:ATP-binding protein [Syntrophales bacterium]
MRINLISKLTIHTSVILLVFMVLFAYINIETLRTLLLEAAISDADKLSETIIKSTHYEMLEDNRERVYEMMREVGTLQGVEHIRMINKSGFITFSTEKEEINRYLDKKEAGCNMCHLGSEPIVQASTMNRSRVFFDKERKQVVGMAKAIYNEPSCYTASCHFHPAKQRILGVLDIIVSLDEMRTLIGSYRNKVIMLTVFLLLTVCIAITLFTHRLVNRPIKQLLMQTKRIAEGNLDTLIRPASKDEMGELSLAFNNMTQSLKAARDELEDWGKSLEAKVEKRTQEIKQIQNQLIRTEKMAALGNLVAGIAHEINNPLTGILMFAVLIGRSSKLDPLLKKDVDTIIAETKRCAKIVQGLLDFSRETIPQKKPASVNDIIDASLALISHQSSFHNIKIIKDYAPDIPLLLMDRDQMEQVFINIFVNASHAMPNGGDLHIKTCTENGAYASIRITDTGCGISEENLGKVFDPFFTTKSESGTGLGLSVCYGIIERHGGTIEVQSKVYEGTTFIIKLPLFTQEHEPKASSTH